MSRELGRLSMRYWSDQAACKGKADTELFYPPRPKEAYDNLPYEDYADMARAAKRHCFGENGRKPCPVIEQCLEWALETNELFGIFGGMSHRERNALVRKRHRRAQQEEKQCEGRCIVCEGIDGEDVGD